MTHQSTPRFSKSPVHHPNAIREYRLKAGLSQRKLGELLGHRRKVISAWERGRRLPNIRSLFGLARELSTLTEALYFRLYRPNTTKEDRPQPKPQ